MKKIAKIYINKKQTYLATSKRLATIEEIVLINFLFSEDQITKKALAQ
jgi:hypothetical protein